MPTMQLTTKTVSQVWASPDGQRKIYELTLDYQGQDVKAKTYSDAIAVVGWSGEVETYEKAGRTGVETFVKQPPKEGGGSFGGRSGKAQADPFTMYLSYAKDLKVARIAAGLDKAKDYTDDLDAVIAGGYTLFQGRPDGTGDKADPVVTAEEVDAPIDLSLVDKVFNTDSEAQPDTPWPPKS